MTFSVCYWANYTQVILEVRKSRGRWPGFEVFVWRWLTSCWILSAMSPEIQEWSHKSRSRINNLYLLTRPIFVSILLCDSIWWFCACLASAHFFSNTMFFSHVVWLPPDR